MEKDDVQLIHDILSGDDEAFNILVEKYQKSVHALAWRKVGDFHYAEEITQDTFLQAYKKLPTLKNPSLFAGWLYVTANRLCLNWMRKQKPAMQSLEATSKKEIEKMAYAHYVSEQLEIEATECRYENVKKLLEELPESERTVVTLHYLGEMTTREIGKFMGVSTNTIKSRLRRARKRLQAKEELLIHEVLGSIRLPANLTEHIMQRVADLKLTPPPTGKPLFPWAALGATTILVILLLGANNQHLIHFQKPYSFDAASEPTIEIIDTVVVLDTDSKPAVRNQIGRAVSSDESGKTGSQRAETVSTSEAQRNLHWLSTAPWTQANGPQGSPTYEIFATSWGTLYVSTQTGIYKLPTDATTWTRINTNIQTPGGQMYMAEHRGTLYIVSTDEIFASRDAGETWNAFCPKPEGRTIGFTITDETEGTDSQADIAMYLAFKDKGVFRSTDAGAHWDFLNDGLTDKRIYSVVAIGNTVFGGTNEGLYRLDSGIWEPVLIEDASKTIQPFENEAFADIDSGLYRLDSGIWEPVPVEGFNTVHSLKAFENNLYVAMGPDLSMWKTPKTTYGIVVDTKSVHGRIFHSTDLGESWTEITPKNEPIYFSISNRIEFMVAGKTFLARGAEHFRSMDAGQTWTKLGTDPNLPFFGIWDNVAVNEKTFYAVGIYGLYRTTDAGDSWYLFMDGIIGTRTQQLVTLNNKFYTHTGRDFSESTDGGESWKSVQINSKFSVKEQSRVNLSPDAKLAVANGDLYGLTTEKDNLHIFRLSTDANALVPVQGMPTLDYEMLPAELRTNMVKAKGTYLPDNTVKDPKLTKALHQATTHARTGGFTVSDGTFYVEYQRGLFKWKPGDVEWTHTGLIETDNTRVGGYESGFKVAVSGDTVYVGMRDGKLFRSLDAGNSWKDITPTLPLHFEDLNEIIFAGSTVYVATDTGVLTSQNGEYWRVLTDHAGGRTVIDRFAVDHVSVYGAGDAGVYRLDARGKWEQILPNVPSKVASLVVSDNKLYVATSRIGMFYIPLREVRNRRSL